MKKDYVEPKAEIISLQTDVFLLASGEESNIKDGDNDINFGQFD